MRVLLINQVFYPDVAATAQHADDLARHLVAHGHEVHAIASRSRYGDKGASLPARETAGGVEIHRVGRSLFGKAGIIARAIDFGVFHVAAMIKALRVPRPDVVVCFTTPPFISLVGWVLSVVRGSRNVYWVMDVYPDVLIACGVLREKSILARLLDQVSRFCLRRADRVVVLGRCMESRIRDKGIASLSGDRLVRIGVWSDEGEIAPTPRTTNPYRVEWNVGDRLLVMYSGNFGLCHDVQTMCRAAEVLKDDDRFRFAFVGGGKRKQEVERFVRDHELTNCIVAPYQPREKLGLSLSAADIHLASILDGAEGCIVPCKLFGVMAAARPCVFIGSSNSELSIVLREHEAGCTVRPGDVDEFVLQLVSLAEDSGRRERLGANAREALGKAYSRERACEQWRMLLEELVTGPLHSGEQLEQTTDLGPVAGRQSRAGMQNRKFQRSATDRRL